MKLSMALMEKPLTLLQTSIDFIADDIFVKR